MRSELNQLQVSRLVSEMTEKRESEEMIRSASEQLGAFLTQQAEESERRRDDECQIDLIVERSISNRHLIQMLVDYGATAYQIDVALCARNHTTVVPPWNRADYGFSTREAIPVSQTNSERQEPVDQARADHRHQTHIRPDGGSE